MGRFSVMSLYVVLNCQSEPVDALATEGTYALSHRSSAQLPQSVRASYELTP